MNRSTRSAARSAALLVAVATGCTTAPAPPAPHLESVRSKLKFLEIGIDEVHEGFAALVEQTRQKAVAEFDAAMGSANLVFSPWSMTRTQRIAAVAHDGEEDEANRPVAAAIGQLNEWQGDLSKADPRVPVLRSQTLVLVDRSLRVAPEVLDVLDVLAQDFDMGASLGRPGDQQLEAEVNDWADRTATTRFTSLSAKLLAPDATYIADVTALIAAWKIPFDPALTTLADFQTASGEHELVPTMRSKLSARTAAGATWRAVELPLADRLVLRALVPDDPHAVLAAILPEASSALDSAPAESTSLALPRWSAHSDLVGSWGGMSHAAAAVAEQGVAVGAAEAPDASSAPPQPAAFSVNRAFYFEILDSGTGLVILAGRVADPTG